MSVKAELAFDICWEVYRGARAVLESKRGVAQPEIALQLAIVEIVGNRQLSIAESDLVGRIWLDLAQLPMKCRQVHDVPARVAISDGRPARVTTDRRGFSGGSVIAAAGPWRTSGERR